MANIIVTSGVTSSGIELTGNMYVSNGVVAAPSKTVCRRIAGMI